jgi:hypothetical protein
VRTSSHVVVSSLSEVKRPRYGVVSETEGTANKGTNHDQDEERFSVGIL